MEFGIFDHLDRNGLALPEFYETRLKLAEAYDRLGFYAYHAAEHHATPLGMAPSPGMFLAALAQRTKRLLFGPLVYTLPLYNPLRLIEEICMLDQMSGGRLQFGAGRGISPIEAGFYGLNHKESAQNFAEALDVVLKGLANPILDHHGKYYQYSKVPMELAPYQKPHPPLWFGGHSNDSAARAARLGGNYVTQDNAAPMREYAEHFRATWRASWPGAALPKIGLLRFVVVAESDEEAMAIARRAYRVWFSAYTHLYRVFGGSHNRGEQPGEFDGICADLGRGFAGSPQTVLASVREHSAAASVNYFLGQFAFGDMSLGETLRSVELFARHVMPALRDA
jgi:alkanesulfonate monooxygenase SsuD/methylene tetrahydromethanopterin reductase-like flavin-dependent oxidoreductase (luciferase family)